MRPAIAEDLRELLSPQQVSTSPSVLEQHSHDESYHTPVLPDAVVFPESTEDVVKVIRYAAQYRVPIVPFGMGSALEGHVVPLRGGISLDMTRMNRVLEVRPDDFLVRVQPGVTRVQLNEALGRYGLFFPVDPGADASLGGMAATNASGTTAVRYGAMRDNVRALEVVLPNGEVIRTGSLAVKSSSGYNLTSLFVGSEGTLGVITELWLRIYGIPEHIVAARAEFPDIQACVETSTQIMAAGIPVARVELVEAPYIEAVNRYKGTNFPVVPTLFLEFRGSRESVEAELRLAREIAKDAGCTGFVATADEGERNRLWEARHHAAYALVHQYPGCKHMATDVCVPLSKLPEAVIHARRVMDEEGVVGAIIGHVGDGNFHASLVMRPDVPDDLARAQRVNERIVEHALALGGTCTGEHGVGIGKKKYQAREHGASLALMQAIKRLVDPLDIMNPGKLVDLDD
jgi:D-lactate dehydrogenase (cytochrome)